MNLEVYLDWVEEKYGFNPLNSLFYVHTENLYIMNAPKWYSYGDGGMGIHKILPKGNGNHWNYYSGEGYLYWGIHYYVGCNGSGGSGKTIGMRY